MKNNQGFTVIELMLAIVIAGLITAAISGFLLVHIRSYETTKDIVDIQYDSQLGLNNIGKTAMESKGLSYVGKNGVDLSNLVPAEIIDPNFFAFRNANDSEIVFSYDGVNDIIYFKEVPSGATNQYQLATGTWFVFLDHISSITLHSVDGLSFLQTDGVYIKLDVNKNGAIIDLSNTFKFRNKE